MYFMVEIKAKVVNPRSVAFDWLVPGLPSMPPAHTPDFLVDSDWLLFIKLASVNPGQPLCAVRYSSTAL